MNNRVTIFIASHSGTLVKQVTVSRIFLTGAAVFIAAGIVAAGSVFFNYFMLQQKACRSKQLTETVASQQNALGEQQQQIAELAGRINTIKKKLFELHEFEKKIRVIANIETRSENASLFGMGGVSSEGIETQVETEERQSDLVREMHSQLNLLESAFSTQEDGFSTLLGYLEDKRQLLASTPAIRPVNGGWVTSRFEYRKSPFTGQREFHQGLDIAASTDTPVMASADGEVVYSGVKGGLGKIIVLDHGRGLVTQYGHMDKCSKKEGDFVKREEIIGSVGNTGQSTGPHLHYEVRVNGVPVNPEAYILN
jgi:murein DD-endopeptidase MepM/ murein hydrolase activator NlpD